MWNLGLFREGYVTFYEGQLTEGLCPTAWTYETCALKQSWVGSLDLREVFIIIIIIFIPDTFHSVR